MAIGDGRTEGSARMRALRGLAAPAANQAVADGIQAAQRVGLQRAVATADPGSLGIREMQQAAGQATQQAGAAQMQAGVEATKQAAGAAKLGVAEQQRADAERLAGQQRGVTQLQAGLQQQQSETERRIQREFVDAETTIARDRLGHEALTEGQLADWAVTRARSAEELAAYEQAATLAHDRKLKLLQTAHQRITDRLQLESDKRVQDRNMELMEKLKQDRISMEQAMQAAQAEAANKAAKWGAIGTVAGTAVGAFGGPAGASAGGSAGEALGVGLGSKFG